MFKFIEAFAKGNGAQFKIFCSFGTFANPCEEDAAGEIAVDELPNGEYTYLPICEIHRAKIREAAGLTDTEA